MEKPAYKTRQRGQIDAVLKENSARHLTAEEITELLAANGGRAGKTTVYRRLDALVKEGSVRKYDLPGGSACFQWIEGGESCAHHHHLVCTGCGRLFHMECDYLDEMDRHLLREHGFAIDTSRTVYYGLCESCAGRDNDENI